MSTRRRSLIAVLVLPIVVLLSLATITVANARTSHHEQGTEQIAVPTITISSFTFTVPGSVRHGALIKVVNKDNVGHTVTSNIAGRFNVVVPARSSRTFHAPQKPHNYAFHCTPHPSMKGMLRVK